MKIFHHFNLLIASVSAVSLGLAGCTQSRDLSAQAQEGTAVTQAQTPESQPTTPGQKRAIADVEALVNLGPRVAGTPVMEQASAYLVEQYRQAGYVTEIQPFTYKKFADQGSTLTVDGKTIPGRALRGTTAKNLSARLVAIPNFGRSADFATVNVKGAIAIVQRGEIRFSEKAENAAKAGAIGLAIVNNESGSFQGALGDESNIPVLALSGEQGKPLLEQAFQQPLQATLAVNARQQEVTGRNVIAHLPGVTQPKVLIGGHYDSVAGSPGANDNASGTAVVLAIARQLSNTPQAKEAWFVAFDGEEDGLHGSRAFVKTAKPGFLSGLRGMINLDMVGVNNRLLASGSPEMTKLAQVKTVDIVEFGSLNYGSDHASFAAADVPVLFLHRGLDPNYHSPGDRQVSPVLLDETAQVGLSVVKQLLASTVSSMSR
jgi:aminopeptidase YwaD